MPPAAVPLPITRVSLYKNGVGFFEHAGKVTGSQSVTIDFTTAQLNDVLQSLTAIDLGGGRIAGAGYNSTTPLEQQLRSLPLALGQDADSAAFYNAIRGARVEVRSPAATLSGRLLSLEIRTVPGRDDAAPAVERRFLTVISDAGSVRTLELTPATEVRLLDADVHGDVSRYLELLAANRGTGLRHLTLEDRGEGTRDLHVSYLSEVPIWKSTYRILFTGASGASGAKSPPSVQTATLQGWSVVDNTTGTDWQNVQLSLIAGAPQSFLQPLSTPYYSRRPEIPLPQEAQLAPQTHQSGDVATGRAAVAGVVNDASGAAIPNAQITLTSSTSGAQINGTSGADGTYSIAVGQPGPYTLTVSAPGFQRSVRTTNVNGGETAEMDVQLTVGGASQTVTVDSQAMNAPINGRNLAKAMRPRVAGVAGMAGAGGGAMGGAFKAAPAPMLYEQAAADSIVPDTTTRAFDDFFEYKIAQPITIRKNESALVPILQTQIDAERVTLWSPQQPTPLRALWITNTSKLTLDRGSFAIVEDGSFGGEGLLDPIHPKERRLLSYAADQAVRVTIDHRNDTRRVQHLTISKGVLKETTAEVAEIEYLVKNAAPEPRAVILEHPVRQGWTLDSAGGSSNDPKPTETTPTTYRFRVSTQANETVRLHLGERHTLDQFYRLVDTSDDQLMLILRNAQASPALLGQLEPVFAAKRTLQSLENQAAAKQNQINLLVQDQTRLRANLSALKSTPEERTLAKRYADELNQQEDTLATLRKDVAAINNQRDAARRDLEDKIEALNLDEARP